MDASRGILAAGGELQHLEAAFGAAFSAEGARSVLLGLRVDRLEHFGDDQRELAQAALGQMLAQRADSETWLVLRVGATWWVLVPGADAKQGLPLARELAQSGRTLVLDEAGKTRHISISCALAHSSHATRPTLATCAAVVEEGLRVATAGGGRRAVYSEVYSAFASAPASATAPKGPGAAVAPARAEALRQVELPRAQAASSKPAPAAPAASPANGRPAEKQPEAPGAAAPSAGANVAETSVLHRRLTKLSTELEKAEAEIARLRAQVAREGEGLASIYREVQGLAEDAASAELKREMMTRLFEANLALRALAGERAKLPA
jgi:hypothetical protein